MQYLQGGVHDCTPMLCNVCRDEIMAAKEDTTPGQPSSSKLLSQRAQHHGLVSGVGGENPAFAMAARLAVRWVAAHMLAGLHLPVQAVELMVVAAFLPGASVMPPPGQAPPADFVIYCLHLHCQSPLPSNTFVPPPSCSALARPPVSCCLDADWSKSTHAYVFCSL